MHLGMSARFVWCHGSDEDAPANSITCGSKLTRTTMWCSTCDGAIVTFNDPRRFGYMKLVARTA